MSENQVHFWHPHLILIELFFSLANRNILMLLNARHFICFQLFGLHQSWPLSFTTHFQRYAQTESILSYSYNKAGVILHLSFVMWSHSLWEHMHVCFIAHGNRGVSAEQIFTCCVVLPQEVRRRRRRRRTSPLVNRTGECILWNLCWVLICFSQRMTQHTVEVGERKGPEEPSPLFRTWGSQWQAS